MTAAHIQRRGGVFCLFRPVLCVTAMLCWAVLRYCCITALHRLLSYASTAVFIRARFAKRLVAAQPLGRVMSFLSFTPGHDVIPRRFSSTKVLVFPLGPCGSGRTRELPYFSLFPRIQFVVGMDELSSLVSFHNGSPCSVSVEKRVQNVFSCD